MSWFGTPHFAMHADFGRALQSSELQTHARHEPQASGAVSLLSAIATALSTAATAALEVVVVRPAVVALLDEGLRAAGHVVEHRAHSLRRVLVVELLHDVLHRKRRVEALRVALRDRQERRIELLH
jgi:hypothetical protein